MIHEPSTQDRPLAKAAVSRKVRRWISVGLVAVAVVVGAVLVAQRSIASAHTADRSRLRIARVTRGPLVRDVVADGRVVAAKSPTLYAIAAGTVDLAVQPGDAVTVGQPLATVASPELQSQLRQEKATLAGLTAEAGRAGLDVEQGKSNAQKEIDQAEIDRQAAARELERYQQVYDDGALSEIDLLRAKDTLHKAEIEVAHAKEDARLAKKGSSFDLGTRQQAVERQQEVVTELEREVDALVIRSPVEGQVGQLLIAQRATVAANAPILTVVDLSAFELQIAVPDSFARDLAIGMTAEIRSGAATFPGRVRSVSPEVVDGNVASRIEFVADRPAGLRQNQRLTARILIEQRDDVLQVERGSFVDTGGGNTAYVVDGDYAQRRPIRTGAMALDAVEILEGVKEGDQIIVSGAETFGDADRVRIAE